MRSGPLLFRLMLLDKRRCPWHNPYPQVSQDFTAIEVSS
jgi:hypothetical protein